jgi:hypothetical protein
MHEQVHELVNQYNLVSHEGTQLLLEIVMHLVSHLVSFHLYLHGLHAHICSAMYYLCGSIDIVYLKPIKSRTLIL